MSCCWDSWSPRWSYWNISPGPPVNHPSEAIDSKSPVIIMAKKGQLPCCLYLVAPQEHCPHLSKVSCNKLHFSPLDPVTGFSLSLFLFLFPLPSYFFDSVVHLQNTCYNLQCKLQSMLSPFTNCINFRFCFQSRSKICWLKTSSSKTILIEKLNNYMQIN